MASVSDIFIEILKWAATLISCVLFCSLVPESRRAFKEKSTAHYQLLPILSLFANCVGWVTYGLLVGEVFPVAVTNMIGTASSVIYFGIFFYFSSMPRSKVLLQTAVVICVLLVFVLYATLAPYPNEEIGGQLGYIAILFGAILFGSPLAIVRDVVKTKNSILIPITMVCVGITNSVLWTTYGVVIMDPFVIVPNSINLAFGLTELALICIYPRKEISFEENTDVEHGVDVSDAKSAVSGKGYSEMQSPKLHPPKQRQSEHGESTPVSAA